ncbi:AraC family transcriptional regulator [Marinobacter bohaiensis]|uniref:AraC family transcriptional regulator n=1 Tax=Marinobacter bohaiensis TaxID=2201898 RepID=UPI000DAF3D3F|nr:AraC family transcriptional regulator [Marinobacter bohaiensis]
MTHQKISTQLVAPVYDDAVRAGASEDRIRQRTGLDPACFRTACPFVPAHQAWAMFELAGDYLPPEYCLLPESRATVLDTSILSAVFLNSPTLEEAFQHLVRFHDLWGEPDAYRLHRSGERAALQYLPDQLTRAPHDAEANLSIVHHLLRRYLGGVVPGLAVHMRHARPDYGVLYDDLFQAPVHFGQPANAIVFDRALLAASADGHNPAIQGLLVSQAQQALLQLDTAQGLSGPVRSLVRELLPQGRADMVHVGDALNMSRWTLARRLRDEGTAFNQVLNEVRKELAIQHLVHSSLPVSEIGEALGYVSPNSFQRAFSQWFGCSPTAYRARVRTPDCGVV